MGEPFGQWKTRANSSNCDTLPITLERKRDIATEFMNLKNTFYVLFSCVCAVPVVFRCMFVSEQLQVDGLRSSLHAPVLRKKVRVKASKSGSTPLHSQLVLGSYVNVNHTGTFTCAKAMKSSCSCVYLSPGRGLSGPCSLTHF